VQHGLALLGVQAPVLLGVQALEERGRIDPAREGLGRVVTARRHDGAQARLVVVDSGGAVGKEGVHVPPSLGGRTDRPRPLSGPTTAGAWRAEW